MNIETIITSVLSSGLVGAVILFLFQKYFSHIYDKKFEIFRSELAIEKEKTTSLQTMIVSGRLSRQEIIDQRRFDAIDKLCFYIREINQMAQLAVYLQSLKIDAVFDILNKDAEKIKIQKLVTLFLGKKFGDENYTTPEKNFNDKFIPQKILDLYDLYESMALQSLILMKTFKFGYDSRKFMRTGVINEKFLKQFPSLTNFIKEHGEYAWLYCIDMPQKALELEIRNFIDETELDYSAIEEQINFMPPKVNPEIAKALEAVDKKLLNPKSM